MSKIAEEADDDVTAEEIFAEAIDAMNDLGRYKGHSPYEMMLGRTPEPTVGDMFGGEENLPMMYKTYSAEDDEYVKNQKVRLEARKAFLETVSLRRLALLELRRTREKTEWTTGQLCYWWTEKAKGAVKQPGGAWTDQLQS